MGAIPELPEGPVTVMFTDIEGSTALRTSAGDAQADALFAKHDELIRAEIEAHRGHDFHAALGDGFLAVFVSTRRAIACAVAIQQALERFNQQRRGAPLRLRIGLNTGEIAWMNGQPSGEAIHAASRVCGAADGGEVFVSDVTRQLAGTVPDVTFTDRGEHTLKGFPHPWKLWALAWRKAQTAAHQDVFVGRERELAELRGHLTSALEGHGGIVLVGGEPGVGKTTLTKELIKEAQERGALALFGRCYESEGAVPYSPFVEIVEQALAVVPPEWILEDLGEDAAEIARMVPVLRRHFPDLGEPLDLPPEQQRRYFFNAITSFITRASARVPTVLVLDDVHWADEPTLLLMEHVATALKELRILGIGTYRDVELDVSRPLAATLERVLRARTATRIPLYRFDRGGVAKMLEELASRPAPPKLVDAIYSETEGNPFFVEEVFRHFVEERKVFDESGEFLSDIAIDELDVPESVRLVVGRRLERLGLEAHKALAAGAVVGRGFSFSLLEAISDVDGGAVLDIVDEAERARVIVPEEREGDVHYTFAHELIRQTLLSSLSIPRRQRIHLAVADAIERTDPHAAEMRPSEIATHLVEAGVAAEASRTIAYLIKAVDRALDAAAFEDAARFIDSALAMISPDDKLLRTQVLERLGHTQRAMSHFEEAIDTWRDVMDGYNEAGDWESSARVNWHRGYLLTYMARFADAIANSQDGLDALGDRMVPDKALILGGRGAILALAGFFDLADAAIDEAEAIAPSFGPAVEGRVAWTHGVADLSKGDGAQAVANGSRGVALLREANDLWSLADALGWLSVSHLMYGQLDDAVRLGEEGTAIAERLGHVGARGIARSVAQTAQAQLTGDLDQYQTDTELNVEFVHSLNSAWESNAYTSLGVVHQLRGRLDEALEWFEKSVAVALPSSFAPQDWAFVAVNHALAGRGEDCRRAIADWIDTVTGAVGAWTIGKVTLALGLGDACAILGLAEEAAALLPAVRDLVEPYHQRLWDGAFASRVAAMTAATIGEWDVATELFELALGDLEVHRNVFERPRIDHWYGKMLLDRGRSEDRDRAHNLIGSALDEYERMGMPVHADMARELIRVNA
jgi:class 3 adenylate cyclase/tetratricopeptide (TPR) repeat protein